MITKLVCFPGYTCGAILCDVLNIESSQFGERNNIFNLSHSIGKIPTNYFDGKEYNPKDLYDALYKFKDAPFAQNKWIGTHCWPGLLDNNIFDQIINVTITTKLSKMYRYARVFYTMLAGKYPGQTKPKRSKDCILYNVEFERVDKHNVINIEFEDWVNLTCETKNTLVKFMLINDSKHLHSRRKEWIRLNDFLYDKRFDYIIKEWEKTHN